MIASDKGEIIPPDRLVRSTLLGPRVDLRLKGVQQGFLVVDLTYSHQENPPLSESARVPSDEAPRRTAASRGILRPPRSQRSGKSDRPPLRGLQIWPRETSANPRT